MSDNLKQIIKEREAYEAMATRYEKTINKHLYQPENKGMSKLDIVAKYIAECDEEDEGIYRNHKFKLTAYQEWMKNWLMQHEYKYMITIKLPHRRIGKYLRTWNHTEARNQLRDLTKQIEQAYTGHNHYERDGFGFNAVFERGSSKFWHLHIAVVANTLKYETYYNRMQEAIDRVLQDTGLFQTCIKLSAVYDQEGLCMYMVKELVDFDEDDVSYLSDMWDMFRVGAKTQKPVFLNPMLHRLKRMVYAATKSKNKKSLFIPNPINKLYRIKKKQPKQSNKQAVATCKAKGYISAKPNPQWDKLDQLCDYRKKEPADIMESTGSTHKRLKVYLPNKNLPAAS